MANSTPKSVTLKMTYDFGMSGDKKVVKSKSVGGIRLNATNEQLLAFANAMFALQTRTGTIHRIDSAIITE